MDNITTTGLPQANVVDALASGDTKTAIIALILAGASVISNFFLHYKMSNVHVKLGCLEGDCIEKKESEERDKKKEKNEKNEKNEKKDKNEKDDVTPVLLEMFNELLHQTPIFQRKGMNVVDVEKGEEENIEEKVESKV